MTGQVMDFRDLTTWQRAMDLVPEVYRLVKKLPHEETFALGAQIRRAVVSIPANIAEGHARQHTKEFLQHLSIARRSLAELWTLLAAAVRLGYLGVETVERLEERMAEIRKLPFGLSSRLRTRT